MSLMGKEAARPENMLYCKRGTKVLAKGAQNPYQIDLDDFPCMTDNQLA